MGSITSSASPVGAPLGLVNLNPATVPLVVKGAPSQSANLQEWQDSTGAAGFAIQSGGGVLFGSGIGGYSTTINNVGFITLLANGASSPMLSITQTNPGASADTVLINAKGTSSTFALTVKTATSTQQVLRVQGAASQTADLQQWQSSTGSVLAKVDASGNITTPWLLASQLRQNVGGNSLAHVQLDQSIVDLRSSVSGQPVARVISENAGTTDLQQWINSSSATVARVDSSGAIAPQNGARITSGSGAPTKPGGLNPVAGDVYHRTDVPGTSLSNIYICVTGGASPTWQGIA